MRYVSPAGAPIRLSDVARWVRAAVTGGNRAAEVQRQLASRHAIHGAALVSTGRAALTLLLRAMHEARPERSEVVLPSYTCFSVAASIAKARLTPRVADVNVHTLDFSAASLAEQVGDRTLAVIATNLFGYPSDFSVVRQVADAHGAFTVDDAAQALGASDGGLTVGGRGDAGLLSFDKGKNVSAIAGGVVLYGPALAASVGRQVSRLPSAPISEEIAITMKALLYSAFLPPRAYWIPNGLPWLGLGITRYTTDYPLARCSVSGAALAWAMLRREAEFTEARRRNAHELMQALDGVPGLVIPQERPGTRSAFLRLPVIFEEPSTRDAAIAALNRAGYGATRSYPTAIPDVPDLRELLAGADAEGGRAVATRIATLPTHPYVAAHDIDQMSALVRRTLVGRRHAGHRPEAAAVS